ncbi:MAG: sulfotransferase family protein [Pseudomonadota bacterium]
MQVMDCRPWNKRNVFQVLRDSTPSNTLGYLFIPLGKAANTEIKRLLWELEVAAGSDLPVPDDYFAVHNYNWGSAPDSVQTPWDSYASDEIDRLTADLMNKFVFTVVRNPYSKLLSAYLDKIVKLQRRVADGKAGDKINRFRLPDVPGSFPEFVEMVCAQPDVDVDLHWVGQSYKTMFHFVKYNHIGHFETLPDSIRRVSGRFSVCVPERANSALHATSASTRLAEYYTDALAEKVYTRYREDFEVFGYDPDVSTGSLAPIREVASSGEYSDFCRPFARAVRHLTSNERRKARLMMEKLVEKAKKVNRELVLDSSLKRLVKSA